MLTDGEVQTIFKDLLGYFMTPTLDDKRFARAIESAACADRDKRIAELERQLEEARKQMDAQKDEWLSWEAKRKALEKAAESYRQLRNGSNWPAVFASHDAPEPLRGEELDAAMQKGQS